MNIFVLDYNPTLAAQYHCDRHVVKMILETAQLLSTAHHVWGLRSAAKVYRPTHVNHPCALWARQTPLNYAWAYSLLKALCTEYTFRYNKTHKTEALLESLDYHRLFGDIAPRPNSFVLAMPDECKRRDAVESYRNYYLTKKQNLLAWRAREIPLWAHTINL